MNEVTETAIEVFNCFDNCRHCLPGTSASYCLHRQNYLDIIDTKDIPAYVYNHCPLLKQQKDNHDKIIKAVEALSDTDDNIPV